MPNHKSAEKRVRQNEKRRQVNRNNRSSLRTQIKKLRSALAGSDNQQSQDLLVPTISAIDKAVNKGILHKNTAARYKARLTGHVNKAAAAQ
ncbi:MAG TPA: 30S ribosomal protein S20 [Pyrinomonadaceae bacterium]|jgi:small subunit ribosomal protein S20